MKDIDLGTVERMRAAKDRIADLYMGRNGVIGVGVGFKDKKGRRTDGLAIRFYVKRKCEVAPSAMVPTELDGLPTDVIRLVLDPPEDLKQPPRLPMTDSGRYLNLQGGISIMPSRNDTGGSGTLGIIVADTIIRNPMMLSNSHVLALSDGRARKGDEICQQSRADNPLGWCGNCGELDRWVLDNITINNRRVGVDAAVARVSTALRSVTMRSIVGIGALDARTAPAQLGAAVRKRGRTTELTSGTIAAIAIDMQNDSGITLRNQIEANGIGGQRFTAPGDSGSLYVTGQGQVPARAIALHWGSAAGRSFGSPIDAVLQALAVQL
jgi:hypothetical protein